eukprot:SM000188S03804  [mRNA]  locus=s188:24816:26081:- [translate_table: standard]
MLPPARLPTASPGSPRARRAVPALTAPPRLAIAQDCLFAPHFPADQPVKFANVHRVFGVANLTKMLHEVPPATRADTVESLSREANARIENPVHGSEGRFVRLEAELNDTRERLHSALGELEGTRQELGRLRAQLEFFLQRDMQWREAAEPTGVRDPGHPADYGAGPSDRSRRRDGLRPEDLSLQPPVARMLPPPDPDPGQDRTRLFGDPSGAGTSDAGEGADPYLEQYLGGPRGSGNGRRDPSR